MWPSSVFQVQTTRTSNHQVSSAWGVVLSVSAHDDDLTAALLLTTTMMTRDQRVIGWT
jgi:hypothetical protein